MLTESVSNPSVIVLAGPNGAGKTTCAPTLLRETLGVVQYVNADLIAQGLAGFAPERAALAAGRVMMARLKELAANRRSFAFETTLASRSFAPWLAGLVRVGYDVHLFYLWLASDDLAVRRVADRVRMGGHGIPEDTIRRRYHAGLRNFFALYQPMARTWRVYDNTSEGTMRLVATGERGLTTHLLDPGIWKSICERYARER